MKKIMFVCLGNICRSPMAEYIFKDMVRKLGVEDEFSISSTATSTEEVGHDMYTPAKRCLTQHGIRFGKHTARQFTLQDYNESDYIFIMEMHNYVGLCRIIQDDYDGKIYLLREYDKKCRKSKDIADPWYTGDFETAYSEIRSGCIGVLKHFGYNTSKL